MKDARQRRFRATIDGTEKSRAYFRLPFDPGALWGPRARYYVAGTINGTKFRGRPDQFGEGPFLPLGPAWPRAAGLRPGDSVDVTIRDGSPPREGLAVDVAAALDADPEAGRFFDAVASFYRKNYLRWIDATTRRPDVRATRIAEPVQLLRAGRKMRPH